MKTLYKNIISTPIKIVDYILAYTLRILIKIYQFTISPDKGLLSFWLKDKVCMHEPHCSQYSLNILKRYGFFRGIFKIMDRVFHCTGGYQKKYDPAHYRVVFFSSAPIGVPFLNGLLADDRFEVVGVVTAPDQAQGRGMKIQENIIKIEAKKTLSETSISTPTKINPDKSPEGKDFFQWLESKSPDYIVVIAYGKIIPQKILDLPKIAPINIHGSLLPKYRGASPLQSVFLDKEKETGITIMKMAASLDTGNMIDKFKFKINFDWTVKNVIAQMEEYGPTFLTSVLRKYGKKMLGEVVQDESKATFCSKIEKESGLIDIQRDPLEVVYNKYRAFAIWPKIYFILDENFGAYATKRVIVEELVLDENTFESYQNDPLVGVDLSANPCITKLTIKPEGKSAMSREDFLKGYHKK